MNLQTEAQIKQSQMPISRRIVFLILILVGLYAWVWYYDPTSALANLPYCMKTPMSQNSGMKNMDPALAGIFMAHLPEPEFIEPNFRIQGGLIILVRFNDDDRLMYADSAYYRYINWHEISSWFNWDSPGLKVSYANYERNGNHVRIFIAPAFAGKFASSTTGEIADGTFTLENAEVLWHNKKGKLVFQSYIVETCPFAGK
jgi:hypothetical protein